MIQPEESAVFGQLDSSLMREFIRIRIDRKLASRVGVQNRSQLRRLLHHLRFESSARNKSVQCLAPELLDAFE